MTTVTELVFGIIICIIFAIGVISNGICLFSLRKHRSVFYRFLKSLAIFDTLVIFFCLWMYSLPVFSDDFRQHVFLPTVPFMLPLVQMFLMASVYCTVVLSLERYLRLCRLQILVKKNANICLILVIAFPLVFYIPKFFEYRYGTFHTEMDMEIDCSDYVDAIKKLDMIHDIEGKIPQILSEVSPLLASKLLNMSDDDDSAQEFNETSIDVYLESFGHPKCADFEFETHPNETYQRIIKTMAVVHYPNTTPLRRNPSYYMTYCVVLNTCFATLLPLLALLYLNTATFVALRNLFKHTSERHRRDDGSRDVNDPDLASDFYNTREVIEVHTLKSRSEGKKGQGNGSLSHSATPGCQANLVKIRSHRSRDSINSYESINRRRKEGRLTRISILIVWTFLFCHAWKLVPTIYELIYSEDGTELSEWPDWLVVVKHISHSLIALNSAVNFLIYSAV